MNDVEIILLFLFAFAILWVCLVAISHALLPPTEREWQRVRAEKRAEDEAKAVRS